MTKTKLSVLSSDKLHTLVGVVYLPENEPKGFFHIVHGMSEHIGRYDKFMSDMADAGYICFGYDNLGHGLTAKDKKDFGYIAKKKGYDLLAQDVKLFSDKVIAEYGDNKKLPYYLLGHSMGSFIVRLASSKYLKPDKLIIMGTGGKNPAAGVGIALTSLIKLFKGDRYISPFTYKLAFGNYNERFGGGSAEDPSPWLTRDDEIRKEHYKDKLCAFLFTVSAMGDLIRLNKITNENTWYKNMPNDLPILLVSGENDPVGDYAKGVVEVHEKLQKYGINSKCIIYPDARHEILNDSTYTDTKNDIIDFLNI